MAVIFFFKCRCFRGGKEDFLRFEVSLRIRKKGGIRYPVLTGCSYSNKAASEGTLRMLTKHLEGCAALVLASTPTPLLVA